MKAPGVRPLGHLRRALRAGGERGVVFIWVLVGLLVMAILLMAAVQPASLVAKREKEKELVFRGEAYCEAIRQYQQEHGGAFPTDLKDLTKPGPKKVPYIRRLYPEPFALDGKWGLLAPGSTVVRMGKDGKPEYVTPAQGGQGGFGQGSANPPQGVGAGQGNRPPMPGATQILPFRLDGQKGQPILGVYSKNPDKAYQDYLGKFYYNQWFFSPLVVPPPAQIRLGPPTAMPQQPGPQAPGQPQSPGIPK